MLNIDSGDTVLVDTPIYRLLEAAPMSKNGNFSFRNNAVKKHLKKQTVTIYTKGQEYRRTCNFPKLNCLLSLHIQMEISHANLVAMSFMDTVNILYKHI